MTSMKFINSQQSRKHTFVSFNAQYFLAQRNEASFINLFWQRGQVHLLKLVRIVCQGLECLLASFLVNESLSFEVEQDKDVADLLSTENASFEAWITKEITLFLFELESFDEEFVDVLGLFVGEVGTEVFKKFDDSMFAKVLFGLVFERVVVSGGHKFKVGN
jgi:hypothetical protein